jgi:hypothetical protein
MYWHKFYTDRLNRKCEETGETFIDTLVDVVSNAMEIERKGWHADKIVAVRFPMPEYLLQKNNSRYHRSRVMDEGFTPPFDWRTFNMLDVQHSLAIADTGGIGSVKDMSYEIYDMRDSRFQSVAAFYRNVAGKRPRSTVWPFGYRDKNIRDWAKPLLRFLVLWMDWAVVPTARAECFLIRTYITPDDQSEWTFDSMFLDE